MIRFHTVYDKFSQALGDFPSVEIDVSDELKEQVYPYICPFCSKSSL